MGTKGEVALLTGVPGVLNLEKRMGEFRDEIKQYPNIKIVTTVACYDDINKGFQLLEEVMQAYPKLRGWFFVGVYLLFEERGSMSLWDLLIISWLAKQIFLLLWQL
ncbi:MAG: substrate-binding domain-containing protein [Dictyoglomaceae bacterium]